MVANFLRALCNPDIYRTLPYSEPEEYSESSTYDVKVFLMNPGIYTLKYFIQNPLQL